MQTSIISPSTSIGEKTTIGHYCIVGDNVSIGCGCRIGHHVVIHDGTTIGDNVRIDDFTTIGKQPMRAPNSAVTAGTLKPPAQIGDDCLIGASVVLYAGCRLGKKVLVADLASIREDVTVGDFTIVGRGVAVENKCEIGRYCKLETNVYLSAYSIVEDRAFLAPCVCTSNDQFMGRTEERLSRYKGVTVRRGGRLGVGAIILPGKEIAPDAVIAAGAVLTNDTEPEMIYTGVPARPFRAVPDDQKLDNQGWKD